MASTPRRRSLALALALSVLSTPALAVASASSSSAADTAPVQVNIAREVDGETQVSTVTVAGQAAASALIARSEAQPDVIDAGRATVAYPVGALTAPTGVAVNDPLYTQGSAYHLAATHADTAWSQSQGANVVVAVLDTAVDTSHPDLDANVLPQLSAVGGTVGPGTPSNSTSVFHGTLVSSLIAGELNNGIGSVGIAPKATIMPITICNPSCSSAAQVAAIDYAATHGANVINMSIAGESNDSMVAAAVARARAAGVVVVASAGNSALAPGQPNPSGSVNNSNAVMYPGATEGVIGVSSVNQQGTPSTWATHNDKVDLSAYGEYAYGAMPGTNGNYTNAYGGGMGTSFSGPEVAGAAALIKAANPALTPDQVESILKSTTQALPAGAVPGYGTGILDAGAATAAAVATLAPPQQIPPTPPVLTLAPAEATNVQLSAVDGDVDVSWDLAGDATGWTVSLDGQTPISLSTPAFHVTGVADGNHQILLKAVGSGGLDSTGVIYPFSMSSTPTPAPNRPPVLVADTATVISGGTVVIDVLANDVDPDGDPLTLAAAGVAAHGQGSIVDNKLSYHSTAGWSGVDTISYHVIDGSGQTTVGTVDITVTPVGIIPPIVLTPVLTPPVTTPVVTPPVSTPVVSTPVLTPPVVTPPVSTPVVTPPVVTAPVVPGNPVRNSDGTTTYTAPNGQQVVVKGSIQARFDALGASRGQLGVPLNSETPIKGGAFNHFVNGSIYWSPTTGAQAIKGAIRDAWSQAGWENSRLGYPTSEEITTRNGGRVQQFQGGLAYWTPGTGAHLVYGAIQGLYASQAWENSRLGYPTGDEFGLRDGGRVQQFQGGLVYWTPTTGATTVWGAFQSVFAAQGWENGTLGYPRSAEYRVNERQVRQDFEGGSLLFDVRTGTTTRL